MRYKSDNETPWVVGELASNQTVYLTLYDLSDGSEVTIQDSGCTEILSTGFYKWSSSITTPPTTFKQYLYIMSGVTNEDRYAGKYIFGGYPDDVFPSGDIISHGDDTWAGETGVKSVVDYISSNFAFSSQVKIIDIITSYISSNFSYSSQVKDLESYGDSNWVTATGFTTTTDLAELESEMDYVSSQVFPSGDIIRRGDEAWITATGFSTHSESDVDTQLTSTHGGGSWEGLGGSSWISSQLTAISSNSTNIFPSAAIIVHGDSAWTTGAGGGSSGGGSEFISSQLNYISSNMALSSQIEAYGGGGGGTKYVVASGRKSPWTYRNKEVVIQQVRDIYDILVEMQKELYGQSEQQEKTKEEINNNIDNNNKQLSIIKNHINNIIENTSDKEEFNEINKRIDKLMMVDNNDNEIKDVKNQLDELITLVIKSLSSKDLEELEYEY